LKPDDRFAIPAHIAAKLLKDEAVLLDLKEGFYFGLNDVGSRIWTLVGEEKSLSEICDQLLGEYDVTRDDLERHVRSLLQELLGKGLIEPVA
jgi:Coenzyme PQQ synthesis protein D (PqqD)